jgi:hypothetical protein
MRAAVGSAGVQQLVYDRGVVWFYLKSLVQLGVLTPLAVGLKHVIVGPVEWDDLPFLLGLSFVVFWLVPTTKHMLATQWISGPERWRVRQRVELLVEMPAPRALERCTEAVKRLPGFRSVRERGGEAREARIGRFGERISFRANAIDEGHTRVIVSSRPVWPLASTDEGRNWKHVVAIRDALVSGTPPSRRRSPEGPAPRARSPRRPLRPPETARTSGRHAAPRAP